MRTLILVDIQRDFVPGGSLAVPSGDEVVAVANQLMPSYDLVVATLDWHPADHLSFASQHPGKQIGDVIQLDGQPQVLWPDHCIQGSAGADFCSDLERERIDHLIYKGTQRQHDSYSGFFDNARAQATGLHEFLQQQQASQIDVVGLATDYCVKATVLDGLSLGYQVQVIQRGVRGVELHSGDCAAALLEMKQAGAQMV